MHRFFISIILSDHKMSMSSLSGSLDMFIISCCLIKRSLQTLESENNYTFTQRWSGWGEKQINYLKSKQNKKSSVFKPCVINLLMTKRTFSWYFYWDPLFNDIKERWRFQLTVQKVFWTVIKRMKKCTKDYLNIFCFDRK